MRVRRVITSLFVAGLIAGACGGSDEPSDSVPVDPVEEAAPAGTDAASDGSSAGSPDGGAISQDEQMFPDVIDATAVQDGATWTVSATLSSPYDTPERYADAWRVVGPDGTVYGERILTHDHASEQPFTRSEPGVEIPENVGSVTIEGRDQQFGYGGETFELTLPR